MKMALKSWKVAVGKGANLEAAFKALECEVEGLLPLGYDPGNTLQTAQAGGLAFAFMEMTKYEYEDEND